MAALSLNTLIASLAAGTCTPEEQRQCAPIFQQMAQISQLTMAFSRELEPLLARDVKPVREPGPHKPHIIASLSKS